MASPGTFTNPYCTCCVVCCYPWINSLTTLHVTLSGFSNFTCGGLTICMSSLNGVSFAITGTFGTGFTGALEVTCAGSDKVRASVFFYCDSGATPRKLMRADITVTHKNAFGITDYTIATIAPIYYLTVDCDPFDISDTRGWDLYCSGVFNNTQTITSNITL